MKPCPVCQSDQFKKAALVFSEGQSVTVGAGVGIGTGGVGVGVGRGITKTMLSDTCSPPKQMKSTPFGDAKLWQILLVIIPGLFAFVDGVNFTGMDCFWLAWGICGLVFLFSKGWAAEREIVAKHKASLDLYDKTYMCLRCGTLTQPFDGQL